MKLKFLKKIIADRLNDAPQAATMKKNILKANSVGEVWCELFSNELFDYTQIKNDLRMEGIVPTTVELLTVRESDKTHALLWLASSERGIKEIDIEDVRHADFTLLNTVVDQHNENFWYKLSRCQSGLNPLFKSTPGLDLFKKIIHRKWVRLTDHYNSPIKLPSEAALNQISKKDNVCTWNKLILNYQDVLFGDLRRQNLKPLINVLPWEFLIEDRARETLNMFYNLIDCVNNENATSLEIHESVIHRLQYDNQWQRVIHLLTRGLKMDPIILMKKSHANNWKNYWDLLISEYRFADIKKLFKCNIFPDTVDQLYKFVNVINLFEDEEAKYKTTHEHSTRYSICTLEDEKCLAFIKSEIEKKLNAIKDNKILVKAIQDNIHFQSRHHLQESNMMTALLTCSNKNDFYGYLYLLYLTTTGRFNSIFNTIPIDLLLRIGNEIIPKRFADALPLLLDPSNRNTFIKWHIIQGIDNCSAATLWTIDGGPLIQEIAAADKPVTVLKKKYGDLRRKDLGLFGQVKQKLIDPKMYDVLREGILLSPRSVSKPKH